MTVLSPSRLVSSKPAVFVGQVRIIVEDRNANSVDRATHPAYHASYKSSRIAKSLIGLSAKVMHALAQPFAHDPRPRGDQVVQLSGAVWSDYERLLAIRGERATPRISYLEGTIEIMTPSRDHETLKSYIGRLVETYCLERGIRFVPVGAWTLKDEAQERGAEPDECYLFGHADPNANRPHLAIEVEWTANRINKLHIYRRLGVGEVWYWRQGGIEVYGLEGDRYQRLERSLVLPGLDLGLLVSFLDRPTAYDAIRDYRAALTSDT